MAPAQSEITDAHVESEVSQQGAGPGHANLGEINEEWKDGDRQVRLPKIDLRQPRQQKREAAADGAKAEVATRKRSNLNNSLSLASSLSIPPQPPRVKLPPQAPIHDVKSVINHQDRPLKKATRSPFPRGTRGRGDPRNARMRAERLKYEAEQLAERQKYPSAVLSSKVILLFLSIRSRRLSESNGSQI